jgi:DNA-binding SARP family transcriptional activator
MALALVVKLDSDVDAADRHEALSLRYAREAGDRIQETRVLANQAHQYLARSRFAEALDCARAAIGIAEVTGPPGNLVVALVNQAVALQLLGRLDESARSFARVIAVCERIGSLRVAAALAGLGDLHRERGWSQQAGHCYRRALAIARESGERDAVLPALLGLAGLSNDRELVHQAEVIAPATAEVVLARGWLRLAAGDLSAAADCARQAAELAALQLGRLAESLQLRAAATTDPDQARAALAEARNVWVGCGATVAADRVVATLAKLPGATSADRLDASLAARRLAGAGVMPDAATIPLATGTGTDSVEIRVLGLFEVRVGGQPVPAAAWQSRKARDLLRLLVARRGQAVPREELAEALWPNEEGSAHRLSVALSIARGALDPNRRHPADRYIIGDASKLALDPQLRVDMIDFLDAVSFGARLYDQDDPQARPALLAAHNAYTGEAFADDPYLDWLAPTRDLVRAAYLRTVRILARLARRAGDADEAVRWLLELLAHDPYDEAAHADLIAVLTTAGGRGEAQRARERYAKAMRTLGIETSAT